MLKRRLINPNLTLEDTKVTEDRNKIVKRKTREGEKDAQSDLDNK